MKFNNNLDTRNYDQNQFYKTGRNNYVGLNSPRQDSKSFSPFLNRPLAGSYVQSPKPNFNEFLDKNSFKIQNSPVEKNYSSKNLPIPSYNPQANMKEKNYQVQKFQTNQHTSNYYPVPPISNLENNTNHKLSEMSPRKQQKGTKNETTLSWTNYIGLELKKEELQKNLTNEQIKAKEKTARIQELESSLNKIDSQYQNKIRELKQNYQTKLHEQKNFYQSKISQKTLKINELIEKLTDETKNCLSEEIKTYLTEVLSNYTELKTSVEEVQFSKQENSKKIELLEKQNRECHDKILKLESSISKLSVELSQANQRLISRNGTSINSNTFTQIIQAQTIQIDQLRNTIQIMNDEQMKLRATQTEAINKLASYQKTYSTNVRRDKSEQNKTISNLGLSLTKKQNENSQLRRKMTSTQSKLKNALQEIKRKNGQLASIAALPINQVPASVKNKISALSNRNNRLNVCDQDHQEQIRRLKQRIALLEN